MAENPGRDVPGHALLAACHRGDFEAAARSLDLGADSDFQDSHGIAPLMVAAELGQLGLLDLLVDRGARPDLKTREGWTPLMFAATHGQAGSVERLLALGADPNDTNAQGWTPLLLAAFNNRNAEKIIPALLSAGARVNHQNNAGVSALHFSCLAGNSGAIRILLAGGADPTLPGPGGFFPQEIARLAGHEAVAREFGDFKGEMHELS